ncbi:DoxX family protein [Rhodococcus sp. WMMA185]|uniref:DoxX family protein n=1 Tax=Rhodococcus sp. WMMA185 TaxID=679318 RepID=UPI0008782C99|nr:DoxX family protein [Rhodococcus sp. WMMA185]AOW92328.1 DoxX family protein [Rhodococcus sp. WMMA185]
MRKDPNESSENGAVGQGGTDHGATDGYGKVASPYDFPTERFPAPLVPSESADRVIPHTDDELGSGDSLDADFITEEIPAYRPTGASGTPDQPTQVIGVRPTAPVATAGTSVRPHEDDVEIGRGTLDLGLLVLRLAVGGTILVHGLQKLTGLWDGPGLGGFEEILASSGFQQAKLLSILGAVAEVAGGALLIFGLVTPLAAASVLAVMINAWAFRQVGQPGLEYFAPTGTEYETLLGVCAGVIILTGPGRISLDGRRGWATRPFVGSFVTLILGIAAGVCVWIFLNGANPLI